MYTASILIASFLLFLVQPILARRILPTLGGTPAVWNSCMLFYQLVLLAGYAYAYLLSNKIKIRSQLIVHALVLLLPLMVLAIGPRDWSSPSEEQTIPWLLAYLSTFIGLPFFALSANSSLVQSWYASTSGADRKAYFLYSASNIGSMTALLAYPTLIEPSLSLENQFHIVQIGYVIFALTTSAVMIIVAKTAKNNSVQNLPSSVDLLPVSNLERYKQQAGWTFLAFMPSSLLLSVTTYITSNIAPCPLLWIIPLALYLLTFIIAFSPFPIFKKKWILNAHAACLVALSVIFAWKRFEFNYLLEFPLHLLTFFTASLVCHTELADSRPESKRLTEFYLCLSIGGALGGIFNTIIAPILFKSLFEYPALLALSCLGRNYFQLLEHRNKKVDTRLGYWMLIMSLSSIALLFAVSGNWPAKLMDYRLVIVLIPTGVCTLMASSRPPFMAALVALMLTVGSVMWRPNVIFSCRNFFGPLLVTSLTDNSHFLVHGTIVHGAESMNKTSTPEPLTYYHRDSPIGQIFVTYNHFLRGANIAVIGLGAGTLAAYAEPDQSWTFYEINRLVVEIAENPKLFTYLNHCRAPYKVLIGDGRRLLIPAPPNSYKLMILDAFSADAIPVHLLTREALQLYLSKLAPDGLLVFHISTHSIDLRPTLRELAKHLELACLEQESGQTESQLAEHKLGSRWFVLARQKIDLRPLERGGRFHQVSPAPKASLWTDDFSNLLETLRFD